jgi:putative Ca2+/H+ antiporter (TMEM165/GDT1 family)
MSTFILSFLMILGSELGDKTFLIAAVLAMRQSRLKIFSATMTAMIVMSILSAELGYLLPQFFPQWTVDLLAAIIFIIFSIVMLREGLSMTGEEQHQELEQVKAELEERQWQINDHEMIMMESGESNTKPPSKHSQLWQTMHRMTCHGLQVIFSPIFLQTFTLVFLAEWGDRSQFATIALAASQNVEWTIIGTLIGHTVCTGIAVIGGRLLAQRISVKTGKSFINLIYY